MNRLGRRSALWVVAALMATTASAQAALFSFDLDVPVDGGPLVTVAHLTVQDIGSDTQFTLSKTSVSAFGATSFLTQLDLAYTGGQVPVAFTNMSGQAFKSFNVTSGAGSDAGYKTWTHEIHWETANNPDRFTDSDAGGSVFKAVGTHAADWVTSSAFKSGVPAGANALVHIQDAGEFGSVKYVGAVPEPSAYAMLLAGLGVAGFLMRRRVQSRTA